MPKFNFFRLSVLSTTKFLFKNAIILIQKYVLKEHCTKKTYLPAIFFGVCDAPTTGCIHIAAQIQILYQALEEPFKFVLHRARI